MSLPASFCHAKVVFTVDPVFVSVAPAGTKLLLVMENFLGKVALLSISATPGLIYGP